MGVKSLGPGPWSTHALTGDKCVVYNSNADASAGARGVNDNSTAVNFGALPGEPNARARFSQQFNRFAACAGALMSHDGVGRHIDSDNGLSLDKVPHEFRSLISHCSSPEFIEKFERATGHKLSAEERERIIIFQRNFKVVFSYTEESMITDDDPANPVIHIQLSVPSEDGRLRDAPTADVFMHEFYHAISGYVAASHVEYSDRQWGFSEGTTDLFAGRHLAVLFCNSESQEMIFPGNRTNDVFRVILLEQVIEGGKPLVISAFLTEDYGELKERFDSIFGEGNFEKYFAHPAGVSSDRGFGAELIRKVIDKFGLARTREFLERAVSEYSFPRSAIIEILDEDRINPQSLKHSLGF